MVLLICLIPDIAISQTTLEYSFFKTVDDKIDKESKHTLTLNKQENGYYLVEGFHLRNSATTLFHDMNIMIKDSLITYIYEGKEQTLIDCREINNHFFEYPSNYKDLDEFNEIYFRNNYSPTKYFKNKDDRYIKYITCNFTKQGIFIPSQYQDKKIFHFLLYMYDGHHNPFLIGFQPNIGIIYLGYGDGIEGQTKVLYWRL